MNKGSLSEYFEGVAVKKLAPVDVPRSKRSNQHEINTTKEMLSFLGSDRKEFHTTYIWLGDEHETITEHGKATHYNARVGKIRPPEYRLYYPSNPVTELMNAGDVLYLAIRPDRSLLFIVVPIDSTIQHQLSWLFGIEKPIRDIFEVYDAESSDPGGLDFLSRFILDEIGVEYEDPEANTLDAIIERFGTTFPSTREFSELARLTLPQVNALDGPDDALMHWLDHEEALFRRLEKRVVEERIRSGFINGDEVDVDDFIQFSLGVHNRRKARMGRALENHLEAVFAAFQLRYATQVVTEDGKRPDFVFPGKEEYFDQSFSAELLTLLAAKSTCKDRWSQILPEGARVETKHLITLEPGISGAQTDTMRAANVQLVVPEKFRKSYSPAQRDWIWKLQDFVDLVTDRQQAA